MGGQLHEDLPGVGRLIKAGAQDVWTVLADGWSYASWVVGAARIRDVDPDWPAPGSRIHHSVGVWPFLISDSTSVLSAEPPGELLLQAGGWPAGQAHVRIILSPQDSSGTHVEMVEDVVAGAALLVLKPVRQTLITWRNAECLRRLAFLAEGEFRPRPRA